MPKPKRHPHALHIRLSYVVTLQVDAIERLVRSVVAQRNQLERSPPPPVLLKLGPDGNLASRAHLAQVAAAAGVDGLIISNTSAPTAEGLPRDTLRSENRTEKGGLSGVPLRERALQACAEMYVLTDVRTTWSVRTSQCHSMWCTCMQSSGFACPLIDVSSPSYPSPFATGKTPNCGRWWD